jgi:hypothetical protein
MILTEFISSPLERKKEIALPNHWWFAFSGGVTLNGKIMVFAGRYNFKENNNKRMAIYRLCLFLLMVISFGKTGD